MKNDNLNISSLEIDTAIELSSLRAHEDLLKGDELANGKKTNFNNSFDRLKTNMKPFPLFMLHLKLLLAKNYIIQKRTRKQTYLQILSPFLISLLIFVLQYKIDEISHLKLVDQPKKLIEPMPKCFYNDDNPNDCFTIAYSVVVRILILS